MTRYSQNGYVACDSSLIAKYTVPGTGVAVNIRKGDVSAVLLDFMAWFHKNIQPLRQSDTGGYNPRVIAGSRTLSNHASGTAVDINWQSHPQGKRHAGFTSSQVSAIHTQLKKYKGVIRWGDDYNGTPDAMHFEINKSRSTVNLIANKIRTGYEHPAGSRELYVKSPVMNGHDVKAVQTIVGVPGKHRDGDYGNETKRYVEKWQEKNGLHVDGRFGKNSWSKLNVKSTFK